MPSQKPDTLWDAKPHTIAKISILEGYLLAWFQILGRTKKGQDLLYVDGFAGPGKYRNYRKGSPIAALIAAKEAITITDKNWVAGVIHCAFIEPDKKRFEHLKEIIKPFEGSPRLKIHTFKASFVDGLAELESEVPRIVQSACPKFVFIDPFGATGVPFSKVREILSNSCSEVLINLDADGIVRIFQAKDAADHTNLLNEIFGDDSWKAVLSASLSFDKLCDVVLGLYKSRLRSLPQVKYVFPFEMRTYANTLNYYLVFASQHPLGLEKMKEVMKRIDQSGTYCFSDASVGQEHLFRFNDATAYSHLLHKEFSGRMVSYDLIRDFSLNETPFVNPKAMLKDLEQKNLIEVMSSDPNRRKGTFKEDKIKSIIFSD